MAQFVAFNKDVEVKGQTVLSVVEGMGAFRSQALKILKENGIDDPASDKWYSQQAWLNAFKEIHDHLGEKTLHSIGKKIPESARFPPEIDSIFKALAAIDVAYHMNHRLNGKVMFDPATGTMTEGIGHYQCEKIDDHRVMMACNNPYPSEFDRGIILTMAQKFLPSDAKILKAELDPAKPTRKNGADSCTYNVSW
jgi:hypothetical protein